MLVALDNVMRLQHALTSWKGFVIRQHVGGIAGHSLRQEVDVTTEVILELKIACNVDLSP